MARAVRKCESCGRLFPANLRRKTCSTECHIQLASTTSKEIAIRRSGEPTGTLVKKANPTHNHWEPSPEYIREQCTLIRAGLLVIKQTGEVERVSPAYQGTNCAD